MCVVQEPRQTTSVLGHLVKPSIQALIHGLNRHYYSIAINYRKVRQEVLLKRESLCAVLRIRDVLSRIRPLLHPGSRIRGVKKHRIPDPTYFFYVP
jgi:hypothetical protein